MPSALPDIGKVGPTDSTPPTAMLMICAEGLDATSEEDVPTIKVPDESAVKPRNPDDRTTLLLGSSTKFPDVEDMPEMPPPKELAKKMPVGSDPGGLPGGGVMEPELPLPPQEENKRVTETTRV